MAGREEGANGAGDTSTKVVLSYQKGGLEVSKSNPKPGDMVHFQVRTDRRTAGGVFRTST